MGPPSCTGALARATRPRARLRRAKLHEPTRVGLHDAPPLLTERQRVRHREAVAPHQEGHHERPGAAYASAAVHLRPPGSDTAYRQTREPSASHRPRTRTHGRTGGGTQVRRHSGWQRSRRVVLGSTCRSRLRSPPAQDSSCDAACPESQSCRRRIGLCSATALAVHRASAHPVSAPVGVMNQVAGRTEQCCLWRRVAASVG